MKSGNVKAGVKVKRGKSVRLAYVHPGTLSNILNRVECRVWRFQKYQDYRPEPSGSLDES